MSKLIIQNNYLTDALEITNSTGTSVIFNTENKYLDKNIKLNLSVKAGAVKVNATTITATPQINNTATSTGYVVSFNKTQSIRPEIIQTGYVSNAQTVSGDITISGKTILPQSTLSITNVIPSVNAATFVTVGSGYYPTNRTITIEPMSFGQQAQIKVENQIEALPSVVITNSTNMLTSSNSSEYYFEVSGTGINGNIIPTYSVTTAGYVSQMANIEGNSTTIIPSISSTTKVYIKAGSVSTSFTGGVINSAIINPIGIDLVTTDINNNGLCLTAIGNKNTTYAKIVKTEGYISEGTTTSTYVAATATNNYYIKGITLTKPVSGTTSTFYLTFPNGANDSMTFNFTIDSNGNVTIA